MSNSKSKNSSNSKAVSQTVSARKRLGLEALEPRILLDAAAIVTGAEMALDVLSQNDSAAAVDAIFNSDQNITLDLGGDDISAEMLVELDNAKEPIVPISDVVPVSESRETKADIVPVPNPIGPEFNIETFANLSLEQADLSGNGEAEIKADIIEAQPNTSVLFAGPSGDTDGPGIGPGLSSDTDGDGIDDDADLDDDNDGITDVAEMVLTAGTFESFESPTVAWITDRDGFESAFPAGTSPLSNFAGSAGYFIGPAPTTSGVTFLDAYEGTSYSGLHSGETFAQESVQLALNIPVVAGTEVGISFAAYQMNFGQAAGGFFNEPGTFTILGIATGTDQTGNPINTTSATAMAGHADVDLLGVTPLITNTADWAQFVISFTAARGYDRILIVPTGTGSGAFLAIDNINFGLLNAVDTDGDGVFDHLDLDSDNDGISDLEESGQNRALIDTNNDGVIDSIDGAAAAVTGDTDNDGLADSVETINGNNAGATPRNSDGDGIADLLDLDSDNDGIADTIEARSSFGFTTFTGTDTDGDGIVDTFDPISSNGHGGTFTAPVNTDGSADGADYIDSDSDNDGLGDSAESGLTAGADFNGDGIGDALGVTYADPDGNISSPILQLTNVDSDASDVDYRSINVPNTAPIIDLNDNNTTANLDFNATFTEGDSAVLVTDSDADVIDTQDNITSLTIVVGGAVDGNDEQIVVNGIPFTLGTNMTNTATSIGGVAVTMAYVGGTLTITPTDGTTPIPQAALDTLIRAISYEHTSDDPTAGNRTLTFSAADDASAVTASSAVATITVVPVNDGPTAQNDTETTNEDTVLSDSVLPNNGNGADSDPDGDTLTVTQVNGVAITSGGVITLASGALLTMNSDGSYDYDPNDQFETLGAGDTASDSFTYQVSDGNGGFDTATVSITINGVNDAPVAVDDGTFDVPAGSSAFLQPLTNDSDPEGDPLTITGIFDPAGTNVLVPLTIGTPVTLTTGTVVTLQAGGVLEIVAPIGTGGPETLDYQISDPNGGTDRANISLNRIAGIGPVIDLDGQPAFNLPTISAAPGTPPQTGGFGVGATSTWVGAVTLPGGGTADLRATVTAVDAASTQVIFLTAGDDPTIRVFTNNNVNDIAGNATLLWEVVIAGVPQVTDLQFFISDIDSVEGIELSKTDLANYILDDPTTLTPSETSTTIKLSGSVDGAFDPASRIGLTYLQTLGAEITYNVTEGSRVFSHDGDGDIPITGGNINSVPPNIDFATTFTEGGSAVDIGDTDAIATDADDTHLEGATIRLTNAKPGDVMTLPTLPAGVTGTIDTSVPGVVTITLSGTATKADYADAIKNITFENTLDDFDLSDRILKTTVTDGSFNSTPATTTITMVPINDAPVALNDTETTTEDALLSDSVLPDNGNGADSDPEGDTLTVTQVNGTAITSGSAITLPSGATLVMNANGSYVYNPNGQFENLAAGDTATDSYTYQISDGNGGFDTATVNITITGVNDAPVAVADMYSTNEDTAINITAANGIIDTNDTDADGGPLTVTQVNGVAASVGTEITLPSGALLTVNANGSFDYNPNGQFESLGAGDTGTDTYTYQISDGNGGFDTETVTINITGFNDLPIAQDDTETTAANATLSDNVLPDNGNGVDSDPEGDTLTVVNVNNAVITSGNVITLPSGALLTMNSDGTYDYNPNGQYDGLSVGQTATDSFTYKISDGAPAGGWTITDGSDGTVATVTITITGANADPIPVVPGDPNPPADPLDYIPAQTEVDGAAVTALDLTPYFDDPNTSDTLTLTIAPADLPGGLSFDGTSITGTPDANASQGGTNGVYTIPVVVTDGNGGSFTTNVTYTITNPVPTAVDDAVSGNEDTVSTGSVFVANGGAVDSDPDGDTFVVSQVNGVAGNVGTAVAGGNGGLFTINADGSYSFDPNGEFDGLAVGETATTTITYTIDDGEGGTDSATVTLTVTGVNDAPIPVVPGDPNPPVDPLDYIPAQTEVDSVAVTPLDLTPYFGDPDVTDTLTLTIDPADLPAGLSFDGTSISGTPDANASQGGTGGVYTIPVVVTDGNGGSFTTNVTYTITNPVPIAVDDAVTGNEDTVSTGSVFVANGGAADNDPDGDTFVVSQVGGVAGNVGSAVAGTGGGLFTINADGSYSFDPNGEFDGLDAGETATTTITYTIDDGEGGTDSATVTLTVQGVNDTPIATGTLTGQIGTDSVAQVPFDASTVFSDPDVEPLVFTSGDLPTWMSIDPVSGIITGTPPADASQGGPNNDGVYTVTVTATDPDGALVTATVDYTFINPAPVVDTAIGPQADIDGAVVSIPSDMSDPDGDTLVYSASGLPTGLSINTATGEITGTLDNSASQGGPNNDGVYTISVTADDGEGGTVTDTFDYTVTNPVPIAIDDAVSGNEDTVSTGSVFVANGGAADSDPDGDAFVVSQVDGVAGNVGSAVAGTGGGLFTINADGSYSFDPNGEFDNLAVGETATTTITYTIDDGEGGTDSATVTLTVSGGNDAPIPVVPGDPNPPADPLDYIPAQTEVDSVAVTALDLTPYFGDPDVTDTLTLTIDPADLPAGLSFDGTSISGTPDANASQGGTGGVYTIPVVVTDGNGGSFTTNVTYTITNPAPIAVDDSGVVGEDDTANGNVISGAGTDTDPDGDMLVVSQVDGVAGNVGSAVAGTGGGLFTINPDGTYSFDTNGEFDGLDDGEVATTTITYQISDGEGGTDDAVVTITVNGENDPPVITTTLAGQNGVDSVAQVPFDASVVFIDVDGDPLSYSSPDIPPWMSIDPVTGVITGTPPADASQGGPNNDGIYTITIVGDDGDDSVSTTVTYSFTNPAPIAVDDGFTGPEDTALSGNILGNDSDPDGDAIHIDAAALADGTAILIGTVTTIPEGTIIIQANGDVTFDPVPNYNGVLIIGYTVSDGEGGTDVATATFTITPVNDAPVNIGALPPLQGVDAVPLPPLDVISYFDDIDGDVLTLTVDPANLPPGVTFDGTQLVGTPDNTASQGGPNNDGVYTILVTATDPNGETVSAPITVTITNPGPVAVDDGVIAVVEDTPVVIDVLGNDSDPDGDLIFITEVEGMPISVGNPVTLPSGATVELGTNGQLTYTPVAGGSGQDSFTYTMSDSDGATDTATVRLDTAPVNDAPVFDPQASLPPQNNVDGETIPPVDLSGGFSDPEGDPLSFTATGLPPGLSIDPVSGLVTGTLPPGASGLGPFVVTVTATDPGGLSISTDFIWTVENLPPVADVLPPVQGVDGEPITISTIGGFDDPDGDVLTYTATGLPPGLSIDPLTGVISGTLGGSASQDGPYTVSVTVTDEQGGQAETSFELTVSNPAPIIGKVIVPPVINAGQPVMIDIGSVTDDRDQDPRLSYSAPDLPSGLILDPVTGVITGTPTPSGEPIVFTVIVDDGEGGVSEITLTLNVSDDVYIGDPITDNKAIDLPRPDTDWHEGIGWVDLDRWFDERRIGDENFAAHSANDASFLGGVVKRAALDYGQGAELWVEAVANRHAITLQLMDNFAQTSDVVVRSWQVSPANGGALPAWVDYARGQDYVSINRSAEQSQMDLRVRALLGDGRTLSMVITVDLHRGIIEASDNLALSSDVQTLDQQVQLVTETLEQGEGQLLKALAG